MRNEIFDKLKQDCEKYCLIIGWVELFKDEDEPGRFYMQQNIEENEYIEKVGCFPHDMIRDAIGDHEWKVDKEGLWEFWCLMSIESALVNSPDYDSYLNIEHIEYELNQSFEEKNKPATNEQRHG